MPQGFPLLPHPVLSLPHGEESGPAAAPHLWKPPVAAALTGMSPWMLQFGGHSWGTPSPRHRGLGHSESLQEERCTVAQGSRAVGAGECQPARPHEQGGTGHPWPRSAVPGSSPHPPAQRPSGATIPSRSSHFTLLTFTATVTTPSCPRPLFHS